MKGGASFTEISQIRNGSINIVNTDFKVSEENSNEKA